MPIPWRIFKKRGELLLAKKPSKKKHQCKQTTVILTEESETDRILIDALNTSINEEKQDNIEVCDSNGDNNISHNVITRHDCSKNDDEEQEEGRTNDGILGSNKTICLLVLKGSLVVGVAILTKRFILGIILGLILLILFEYVGDFIIQHCGHCELFVRMIRGFVYTCNDSNECKEHVEVNNGLDDVKECDGGIDFDRDNEHEVRNSLVFSLSSQDEGNVVSIDGEIEHENVQKFVIKDSKRIDDEMWDKIVTTIESLDPNVAQRNSCYALGGLCELQGITFPIPGSEEEESIALKMATHNCKTKKGRKFWKKFVIKHKKNKPKNNNRDDDQQHENDVCEINNVCTEKFEPDLGDDDEEYDGEEQENFESLLEVSRITNHKFSCDNCVQISYDMFGLQGTNSKVLIMILVALGGLIQGRIFAIILIVISCFVLKMVKI